MVEAHVETSGLDPMHVPTGPASRVLRRTYVARTPHPTAYCSTCKAMIWVGPSPDEEEARLEGERQEQKTGEPELEISIPGGILNRVPKDLVEGLRKHTGITLKGSEPGKRK